MPMDGQPRKKRIANQYQAGSVAFDYSKRARKPKKRRPVETGYAEPRRKVSQKLVKNTMRMAKERAKSKNSVTIRFAQHKIQTLSPMAITTIVILFLGLISTALPYAMEYMQNVETSRINDQLQSLKNDDRNLSLEISKGYDLRQIQQTAQEKLGMISPQPYQVIDINVPKQSYSVLSEKQAPINKDIASASNTISNIFNGAKTLVGKLSTMHLMPHSASSTQSNK